MFPNILDGKRFVVLTVIIIIFKILKKTGERIRMKKTIALSTVLALAALGMACAEAPAPNAAANKAMNAANAMMNAANAAMNSAANAMNTASNAMSNAANAMSNAAKPVEKPAASNSNTAANANHK